MFARITPFKMKAGTRDAATDVMNGMKADVMALPGFIRFICAMNEDGSGYVVTLVESREISDANTDKVRALWGRMGEFLEEMPVPQGFDALANWPE